MTQFQYVVEQHYELGREHPQNQALSRAGDPKEAQLAQHRLGQPRVEEKLDKDQLLARVKGSSQQVVDMHIVGDIKTCRERIHAFREEAQVNYMVLNISFGGMPQDLNAASLRSAATQSPSPRSKARSNAPRLAAAYWR